MSDVDHTRDVCDGCGETLTMPSDPRVRPEHTCPRKPPFFGGAWNQLEDLHEWDGALDHLAQDGVEVLYASYDTAPYEGEAWALWREDGSLWEAHCSHCSCNGLDYFSPEETSAAALLMRPTLPPSVCTLLKEGPSHE